MGRGRKRKHNPTIPAHIKQDQLPAGIYWDKTGKGRWYVIEPDPEGGVRAKTVASAAARLSDLHAIMEQRAGKDARGTVGHVMVQFKGSTVYAELAKGTRDDYDYCERQLRTIKTKLGVTFDTLHIDRLQTPVFQRLNERIAKGRPESWPGAKDAIPPHPTKANKIQRYLRRLFAWGKRHGHCHTNPADGVELAVERKRFLMPEHQVYAAALNFARDCGARKAHTKGSCPPYLWCVMEIAYLCRMRGIEVIRLTDWHATAAGLRVSRVKGSRDNVVRWAPRLRAAWDAVLAIRAEILARPANRSRPVPIRAEERFVFVSQSGAPLTKSAVNQAWQDFMPAAIEANIITAEQRFTLHGLKHRGITDSVGDKKQASGHKSAAMVERYDHEVPLVDPAVAPEFSGEFSGEGEDRGKRRS
jgi:hypothetical protein